VCSDTLLVFLVEEMQKGMKIQEEQIVKKIVDATNSERKSMSKATDIFVQGLLGGYGIDFSEQANREPRQGRAIKFSWTGGEERRSKEAFKKVRKILQWNTPYVELIDARKRDLCLHIPGKVSKGQLDGLFTETQALSFFGLAHGGLELKTNSANFNVLQMILETIALSMVSTYRQGVAVLGTDLNHRWATFYFDRPNHVLATSYSCGNRALHAFKDLLNNCNQRHESIEVERLHEQRERLQLSHAQRLDQIPEVSPLTALSFDSSDSSSSEQDLSGTAIPPGEAENLEQFQLLQAYANHLSSLHGCDLHAPSFGLREHSPMSYEHSPMSPAARAMFG
jgi:hypothetical protein